MSKNKEVFIVSSILIVFSLILIYLLQGNITGFVILENITQETALDALQQAETNIKDMQNYNLSTIYINDTLSLAKKSYYGEDLNSLLAKIRYISDPERKAYAENLLIAARRVVLSERIAVNYTEVLRLTNIISKVKKQSFDIKDNLQLLEIKEKQYSEKGIDTAKSKELLAKTKEAFIDERYDESSKLLTDAETMLEQERVEHTTIKGLTKLSMNFFRRNWLPTLIILGVLALIGPKIYNRIHIKLIKNKLELLRIEQNNMHNLIKKLQYERFQKNTISARIYQIKMNKYLERKAEIKEKIPILESILGKKIKKEKQERGILKI